MENNRPLDILQFEQDGAEEDQTHLLFTAITDTINSFDEITKSVRREIIDKIPLDKIPLRIFEVIASFPDRKQREAKGMLQIAHAAFIAVSELSGKVNPSRPKADGRQIYSLADGLSSAVIGTGLKMLFPEYAYLDEEHEKNTELKDAERCWIIDPVDGSAGIVRGLNTWAVGIALHENDDVKNGGTGITLGCIISPQGDDTEVIFGGKNLGAYNWNGDRVRVSPTITRKDLSFSVGSRDVREMEWIASLQVLGREGSRVYAGVDTQHAGVWLARGSIDLLVRMQQPSYDIAPVVAITEGAGGQVREMNGKPIVVQRDKIRRHDLVAWNGTEEIIYLFDHVLNSDMDTVTSNGGSLIESLRAGAVYKTHTLLLRKSDELFLRLNNRFGQGVEWDFSGRKIDSPSETVDRRVFKEWINDELEELSCNSSAVPLSIPVEAFQGLASRLGVKIKRENITTENIPIEAEARRTISPNIFLKNGGIDNEQTTCMVVDVSQIDNNIDLEGQWVAIDELLSVIGEWNQRDSIEYKGCQVSPVLAEVLLSWSGKPYRKMRLSKDNTFFWEETESKQHSQ